MTSRRLSGVNDRGDVPHGPSENGDDLARGGVPQTTGLPIHRANPLSIRAKRQPLDRLFVPEQYRHFFCRRRVPETNGRVGGTRGEALAIRTVGQRPDGAFMAT